MNQAYMLAYKYKYYKYNTTAMQLNIEVLLTNIKKY